MLAILSAQNYFPFRALLASYFLNERLNLFGKVGCLLCVVGSTIIVIHSPEEQQSTKMKDLALKLIDPGEFNIIGWLSRVRTVVGSHFVSV